LGDDNRREESIEELQDGAARVRRSPSQSDWK